MDYIFDIINVWEGMELDISFGLHVLYIKSDFEKAYDIV